MSLCLGMRVNNKLLYLCENCLLIPNKDTQRGPCDPVMGSSEIIMLVVWGRFFHPSYLYIIFRVINVFWIMLRKSCGDIRSNKIKWNEYSRRIMFVDSFLWNKTLRFVSSKNVSLEQKKKKKLPRTQIHHIDSSDTQVQPILWIFIKAMNCWLFLWPAEENQNPPLKWSLTVLTLTLLYPSSQQSGAHFHTKEYFLLN